MKTEHGWGSGLIGVILFSGSMPATRVAVADFSPIFLTAARAVIPAIIGLIALGFLRQKRPGRGEMASIAIVSAGVVVGFPLLTALALQHITAAHSLVFIGLLPLSTAIFATWRGGERPGRTFWVFAALGGLAVAAFALAGSNGASLTGDLLMVAAVVVCGFGYAEGGALSRRLGGWQVICWALALALPVTATVGLAALPVDLSAIGSSAWIGLGYVSIFSMLVGFVFWYRGLALGGVARVGQLQLLQPFFGLGLSALVLGEPVTWTMFLVAGFVVVCVALARRFSDAPPTRLEKGMQ